MAADMMKVVKALKRKYPELEDEPMMDELMAAGEDEESAMDDMEDADEAMMDEEEDFMMGPGE